MISQLKHDIALKIVPYWHKLLTCLVRSFNIYCIVYNTSPEEESMQIFIESAQPSSWLLYSAVIFMQRGHANVCEVWKQKLGHIKSQSLPSAWKVDVDTFTIDISLKLTDCPPLLEISKRHSAVFHVSRFRFHKYVFIILTQQGAGQAHNVFSKENFTVRRLCAKIKPHSPLHASAILYSHTESKYRYMWLKEMCYKSRAFPKATRDFFPHKDTEVLLTRFN